MKCIDCSYIFFLTIPQVYCDCENVDGNGLPVAEGGVEFKNIFDTDPNEEALVCDDYILTNVDPVILYVGEEPVSAGIRLNMLIHPESELFLSFADYLLTAVGAEVDFFKSQLTVYSEMPINLNDYAGVRRLLTTAPRGEFSNMIQWDNEELLIFKASFDNYESVIGEVGDTQGLIGVLEKVFYHVSNKSIGDPPYGPDYCAISGGGDDGKGNRGVECPGIDGVTYPLMIKPGLKINKTGNKLCEYECYQQNTLDTWCPNGLWDEVFCFDFADVNAVECPNCTADEVAYTFDLCGGDECIGATSPDISKDDYVDIVTGSPVDLDIDIEMKISSTIPVCRPELFGTQQLYDEVVESIIDSCDNIDSDDLISVKCNNINYDPEDGTLIEVVASCDDLKASGITTSGLAYWPPYPSDLRTLGDCALTLSCDSENSDIFTINIINNADEINCDYFGAEEAYTGVCDLTKGLWITRFSDCGSKGVYEFSFSDETHFLELKDVPAVTFFKSLLTQFFQIRETYKVLPFGNCSGGDFEVILEPIGEADIFSKSVKVPYADLHDRKFNLVLSNPSNDSPYELNVAIECVGVDCA